jgi:uncharacterized protein
MHRLFIIFIFCIWFCHDSFAQQPGAEKSKETIITKIINANQSPLKDSVFLEHLARVYGDSILNTIDSLLKDSSFLKSIGDSTVLPNGEFASSVFKVRFPIMPTGWTNDYEHLFTAGQISVLDSMISAFEKETTNEIGIITIDSSWTTAQSFDSLTLAIANNWGIGKKDKHNGILIGISAGLRTIRIENGYGIEERLTDEETKKIINDYIIPEFKRGDFFEGTKNGLLAIIRKLR